MPTVVQRVQDGVRTRDVGCQSDSAETRDIGVQVDLLTQHLSWSLPGEPGGGAVLQQGHLLCLLCPAPHHTPLPTMPLVAPPPAPPPQPWSTELHQAASLPIMLQCEALPPPPPGLIAPLSPCLAEEEQEEEQEEQEEHTHALPAANHSRASGGRKRGTPREEEEERARPKKRRGPEEQKEQELTLTQEEVKEAIKRVKTEEEVQQEAEGRSEEQSAANHSAATGASEVGGDVGGDVGVVWKRCQTQKTCEQKTMAACWLPEAEETTGGERRRRRREEHSRGGAGEREEHSRGGAGERRREEHSRGGAGGGGGGGRSTAEEEQERGGERSTAEEEQERGGEEKENRGTCLRPRRRMVGPPIRYLLESEELSHDRTPANQGGASVCKGGTAPQKKSSAGGGALAVTDMCNTTETQKTRPPAHIKTPDWLECSRKRQRRSAEEKEQQQEVLRPRRRRVGPPIRYLLQSEELSHGLTPANQNRASVCKGGTAPQKKSDAGGGASAVTDSCDITEIEKSLPFVLIKASDWLVCSRKCDGGRSRGRRRRREEEEQEGGAEEEEASLLRSRRRRVGPPIRYLLESEELSHDQTPANQNGASVCKGGTAPQKKKSSAVGGASDRCGSAERHKTRPFVPVKAPDWPGCSMKCDGGSRWRSQRRGAEEVKKVPTEEKGAAEEERGGAEEEEASLLRSRRRRLFARLEARRCLKDIEPRLFPEDGGPDHGEVVELCGAEGTGKTELLYHLLSRCVLPAASGGLEVDVVFLDTDYSLDMLRLVSILDSRLSAARSAGSPSPSASSDQGLLRSCLSRLLVVHCSSSSQLLLTLHFLETSLSSRPELALLLIDSVSAFYWLDRGEGGASVARQEEKLSQVVSLLGRLLRDYRITVFASCHAIRRRSGPSSSASSSEEDRPFLCRPWQRLVTHRLLCCRQEAADGAVGRQLFTAHCSSSSSSSSSSGTKAHRSSSFCITDGGVEFV
ncbi:uncharacterized protein V6R79_004951 [Siganus canaliculatus]